MRRKVGLEGKVGPSFEVSGKVRTSWKDEVYTVHTLKMDHRLVAPLRELKYIMNLFKLSEDLLEEDRREEGEVDRTIYSDRRKKDVFLV